MSTPTERAALESALGELLPEARARAVARTVHPQSETLVRHPNVTLRGGPTAPRPRALDALTDGARAPLIFEGELGRGGMGVVRLATQTAVGRKVAVKTLRPSHSGEKARLALLQEAWATGAVEHPNIVPVYDLGLDADGRPQVVLKRITGVPWSALIDDPDELRERFGVQDPLSWHMRTLMQVCTAIHFAHDRGVLHRDLKPENVMVGDYGEIYVLDWGIAVAYRPGEGTERLPSTDDISGLAGTPAYMAPEMLEGAGALLGPHTDIYLLGGLLYHILAEAPPHRGATVLELLLGALRPPKPPPGPEELVQICATAMATEPGDRYDTAEVLRQALQGFLDHQHSAQLAGRAQESLSRLRTGVGTTVERYRLYGECRFGFTRALDSWPLNAEAHVGLVSAGRLMVEYALDAGQVPAAEALLGDLAEPPPDLVTRIEAARASAERERARHAHLARQQVEMDSRHGRLERSLVFAIACLGWVAPASLRLFRGGGPPSTRRGLIEAAVGAAITLAAMLFFRRAVGGNRFNRRIAVALVVGLLGEVTLNAGAALADAPTEIKSLFALHHGAFMAAMFAITLERRLALTALGFLAAYFTAATWPGYRDAAVLGASALMVLNIGWVWVLRPRAPDEDGGLR